MVRIIIDKTLRKTQGGWNPILETITIPERAHPAILAHELAHAKRHDTVLSHDLVLAREIATWERAMATWQGRKPISFIRRCLFTYAQSSPQPIEARQEVTQFLARLDNETYY